MMNTQYNMHMIYHRTVHLKHIILLTNVTPINSILKIYYFKKDFIFEERGRERARGRETSL